MIAATLPPVRAARLQGQFELVGRVTTAIAVPGERRGKRVMRAWTFTPLCPVGACATVALRRARAHGVDSLVLHRISPAHYAGAGVFYAPLRCAGRTYPAGEKVPFKIKLHITQAALVSGVAVATRVRASYINRERINLTPCVGVFGHDAATYRGQLIGASTPSPAATSARSPAGS
jgi:hypothetical protein